MNCPAFSHATQAKQANPHGLAVEILNPYSSSAATHRDPTWNPPGHWKPWLGDWSVDLWKGSNQGPDFSNTCGLNVHVKARVLTVPGGAPAQEIRAKVLSQGYACRSRVYIHGGYMQQIGIYACYDSTWYYLGWVLYAHLDNMAHRVDDVFDPANELIGTVFQGGVVTGCWKSCHMHLEFRNTKDRSSYSVTPSMNGIASTDRIGIIGAKLSGTLQPATDCAEFVNDINFPDGAPVSPGENFDKGWRLKNCGDTAWSGYQAVRIAGSYGPEAFNVPTVGPGETGELWTGMTAPAAPGRHRATYQLKGTRGNFGQGFWVEIVVRQP